MRCRSEIKFESLKLSLIHFPRIASTTNHKSENIFVRSGIMFKEKFSTVEKDIYFIILFKL